MTYIPDDAIISDLNESTTPLGSGATFTGTFEQNTAGDVMVSCVTDNSGTIYLDFSDDGTNVITRPTNGYAVESGVHEFHVAVKGPQYFRVRLVNDAGAQTYLRLHTYFGTFRERHVPISETVKSDTDALVVRSVGVGQTPTNTFENNKQDGIAFSTSTLLTNGQTYDSGVLSLDGYTQVQTDVRSDGANGTITIDFCADSGGTDILRTLTIPYVADSGFQLFSAPAFTPYVRYRFTCDQAGQTDFWFDTKFITKSISGQILGLDAFISPSMVANLGRNVLVGQTDGGQFKNVPLSSEGHLEIALHDPILPFGSIHTESMTPIFQSDAVYGINEKELIVTEGVAFHVSAPTPTVSSGTVTTANASFTCATGTTAFSFSTLQSRKRLRYRPGQGSICRFTAHWPNPVASSIVVAGCGSGESGYFFGYNGTSFGVLHSTDGIREIQTFTVTAATSTGGTVTFRLNGLDYTVTLATKASTIDTANDIASQDFPGWDVSARGNTVIFLAGAVGNKTGTFSITLGTAVGTAGSFAQTLQGQAATDTWIAQADWNGDPCDGTGPSGFNLDTAKGNLFQINIAWLGYGPVIFKIMVPNTEGNNAIWVTVHTINNPNARTHVHANQPAFPFTASAYSAGSTTDTSVVIGSIAGFVEGEVKLTGPRSSFSGTSTAVGSAAGTYYSLFSIKNDIIYGAAGGAEIANQAVSRILSFGGAHDDATPVIFYLIKDATLVGAATEWKPWADNSALYYDEDALTCTFTDNQQIVQVIPVGQGGNESVSLEDTTTLQPGESLTVAARAVTGTSTYTIATLNLREDQ
jgi:hypothetical protein